MAFTSHIFLFYFLPAVLLLYHAIPQRWLKIRNAVVLAAGYVFYAWVNPWFAGLLLAVTVVNYGVSLAVAAAEAKRTRILWTALAVAADLGTLAFFKYAGFAQENLNRVLSLAGHDVLPVLQVALPVGISFYTFRVIGGVVDVHRGQSLPARSLLDFACYVSFFPQLLSGPIQRFGTIDSKSDLAPTFAEQLAARSQTLDQFSRGAALFMLGFAKKILL
ncbi:MAG TPA: hypothetical protein PLT20_03995, partial [Sedimentisphaerales bacterium]|nr:hypothetical protein [Sedimentisphaerales bacterium]